MLTLLIAQRWQQKFYFWFFLIAIESFTLGEKSFQLPGLGSYLATAANQGNFGAIASGLAVLISVIIAIDFLVWQPLIAWVEKFKFQMMEAASTPQSTVLDLLRRSPTLRVLNSRIVPIRDSFDRSLVRAFTPAKLAATPTGSFRISKWINWVFILKGRQERLKSRLDKACGPSTSLIISAFLRRK